MPTYSTPHTLPIQSGSVCLAVATHGTSPSPYNCSGKLYGTLSATTADLPSSTSPSTSESVKNVAFMTASSAYSSGQTRTPISYDAMRTSPVVALGASPQACLDRLADVSRAQSMDWSDLLP